VSRGLYLAPFDELVEPGLLAELAIRAEIRGWDGVFLWDHVAYRPPVDAIADPWVALAAIATATDRIRIGTLVTALSRRRVQKLARETVTLDRLSGGRLVLGVGLGVEGNGELEPFGEVTAPRERARLLDEGLETLVRLWGGGFSPPPLQPDGIPVWVAARWPNRRPLRRAARWHGLFPTDLPDPTALRTFAEEVGALRDPDAAPLELVVELPVGADPSPWAAAGATWLLTGFGETPRETEVRAVIEAGPAPL
jgi:alkanesulfonate monooxygenase SsuD/methylene tetrahydromethanopterin reductase-like flavin-dependent oxidoreductase (luciferase family)